MSFQDELKKEAKKIVEKQHVYERISSATNNELIDWYSYYLFSQSTIRSIAIYTAHQNEKIKTTDITDIFKNYDLSAFEFKNLRAEKNLFDKRWSQLQSDPIWKSGPKGKTNQLSDWISIIKTVLGNTSLKDIFKNLHLEYSPLDFFKILVICTVLKHYEDLFRKALKSNPTANDHNPKRLNPDNINDYIFICNSISSEFDEKLTKPNIKFPQGQADIRRIINGTKIAKEYHATAWYIFEEIFHYKFLFDFANQRAHRQKEHKKLIYAGQSFHIPANLVLTLYSELESADSLIFFLDNLRHTAEDFLQSHEDIIGYKTLLSKTTNNCNCPSYEIHNRREKLFCTSLRYLDDNQKFVIDYDVTHPPLTPLEEHSLDDIKKRFSSIHHKLSKKLTKLATKKSKKQKIIVVKDHRKPLGEKRKLYTALVIVVKKEKFLVYTSESNVTFEGDEPTPNNLKFDEITLTPEIIKAVELLTHKKIGKKSLIQYLLEQQKIRNSEK